MEKFLWGCIFILFDLTMPGSGDFSILPDFVGCFLLMKGMEALADQNVNFARGRVWAFAGTGVGLVQFIWSMMNPESTSRAWIWGLGLACLAVEFVAICLMVRGLCAVEPGKKTDRLKLIWIVQMVIEGIEYLFSWVPVLGVVCSFGSIITGVCFLIMLSQVVEKPKM